jgi:hypothetical protein
MGGKMKGFMEGEKAKSEQFGHKNIGNEVPQIRPIIRFWARFIDIIVFSFIIVIFTNSYISIIDLAMLSFLLYFLWIFVEAILLSTWGTTPGKYLLNITLRDSNEKKLSFRKALSRSFFVWAIGLGFGLITLITLILEGNILEKSGRTTWDRYGDYIVLHKKIGVFRTLITVLFLISYIILLIY